MAGDVNKITHEAALEFTQSKERFRKQIIEAILKSRCELLF